MEEHRSGKVKTTHRLKEPVLLYYEAYRTLDLASEREYQLKCFGSAYYALLKRIQL